MNYDDGLYASPRPTSRPMSNYAKDLESVGFAVLTFLSGGVILFSLCFVVTKCLQCYKARQRRLKRRAMGEEDDELTEAVFAGAFHSVEDDEEETRLVDL